MLDPSEDNEQWCGAWRERTNRRGRLKVGEKRSQFAARCVRSNGRTRRAHDASSFDTRPTRLPLLPASGGEGRGEEGTFSGNVFGLARDRILGHRTLSAAM